MRSPPDVAGRDPCPVPLGLHGEAEVDDVPHPHDGAEREGERAPAAQSLRERVPPRLAVGAVLVRGSFVPLPMRVLVARSLS